MSTQPECHLFARHGVYRPKNLRLAGCTVILFSFLFCRTNWECPDNSLANTYSKQKKFLRLFATLWTVSRHAPLSMGILQARILEWIAISFSRGSFRSKDWTSISYGPVLQVDSLSLSHQGSPYCFIVIINRRMEEKGDMRTIFEKLEYRQFNKASFLFNNEEETRLLDRHLLAKTTQLFKTELKSSVSFLATRNKPKDNLGWSEWWAE